MNTRAIREERKQSVDNLLFVSGTTSDDLKLLDDELLDILVSDHLQPDAAGQLPPFSPVLINIIRRLLAH